MKPGGSMGEGAALTWFLALSVLAHVALLSLQWPSVRRHVIDAPLAIELVRAGRSTPPAPPGTRSVVRAHGPLPPPHRQAKPLRRTAATPPKSRNHSATAAAHTTTPRRPAAAQTSPVHKPRQRSERAAPAQHQPRPAAYAPHPRRVQRARPPAPPSPAVAPTAEAHTAPGPRSHRASAALDQSAKKALLRRALARQLAFHRYYPPLARSRGWQGEVRLGVRVGSDGRLSRVRVLQTSGHALLDRAAVRSLHAVQAVGHPPQWLRGTHFDIVLPVVYKLLDG